MQQKRFRWKFQPSPRAPYRAPAQKSTRRGRPFPVKSVLVVLLIGSFYLVFGTRTFAVTGVTVTGTRYLEKQQMIEKVDAILSENRWFFIPARNFFFVPTAQVSAALSNIRLERITVKKSFPNGLSITVVEKQPKAAWRAGDKWYELDKKGIIINQIVLPSTDALKVTFANSLETGAIGKQIIQPSLLNTVLAVNANLPDLPITKVSEYVIDTQNSYSIGLRDTQGITIYFSTELPLSIQTNKLSVFYAEKTRTEPDWLANIDYIDLRYGSTKVYYK
ncbi:hypothetical protein COV04_02475 [Candidatus Uhrbacteria bacterium CG10_big_fil_rev_8_21_14_0_10_48_11]|uniref:POTRA domain-containing protein n=1 Tax=Candidatus Uhrbacteria bacterium CG10_big_fil_rev_8_21_14_0_10_48_11 TaxID=1975037 RepID=A0A2M8LED1_9BACT|nr:MAG: hypothetical protein COV04_02475 [Candidatus Uhrbacteria bacterium CG10_big_fil_rev_8_21_14_0_10_48_11]